MPPEHAGAPAALAGGPPPAVGTAAGAGRESNAAALVAGQAQLLAVIIDGTDAGGLLAGDAPAQARGLAVYRNAYLARLREALAENYSVFARALGDEGFAQLADAYAAAHPPTASSLRPYGQQLDEFLAGNPLDSAGEPLLPHPALRDLARMDRALRDAFDAPDAAPLTPAHLATLPAGQWPDLQLQLLPSAHLVRLQWSVEGAWHALNDAQPGHEPELPVPTAHAHTLLVWRPDEENRWRSLQAEEEALLDQLRRGRSFGELGQWLATLRGDPGEATSALVGWLQQWLTDACLAAP